MKFSIWQNTNLNLDDWRDDLKSECPYATENELWDYMESTNLSYLEDERDNLKIRVGGDIIILAHIGRWDGVAKGYRVIRDAFISECLYDECEYCEWYCDENDFRFTGHHHDGTNNYLYRLIRPELSDRQRENFEDKLRKGLTKRDISRYTLSLRPYIKRIYGF